MYGEISKKQCDIVEANFIKRDPSLIRFSPKYKFNDLVDLARDFFNNRRITYYVCNGKVQCESCCYRTRHDFLLLVKYYMPHVKYYQMVRLLVFVARRNEFRDPFDYCPDVSGWVWGLSYVSSIWGSEARRNKYNIKK